MDETKKMIMRGDKSYALSDLPQDAHDAVASLQFVEARLQQLRGEMAVSQTANVASARSLKS